MKHKNKKTAQEIIDDIDKRNEYLNKLDKIREEREKLKDSSFASKVKDKQNCNGELDKKNG
ncbi:MAG TPA: hypothetical protein VMZ91_08985 [Candidatus Paceibacterota bacterium]|nr:hypothetical protein [Candidatus Paceibacterota bacterium]